MYTSLEASPTIMIASCSVDNLTWEPVASNLTARGHEVIVYEADKVADQSVPFEMVASNDGVEMTYGLREFCTSSITAAWYRRPAVVNNPQKNLITQMSLDMERRMLQASIWDLIPEKAWINSPDHMHKADRKISQLLTASNLGFNIPETVISNDWNAISRTLPEEIICKSSYSIFFDGNEYRPIYATPFTNTKDDLPLNHNPYPGIWQTRKEKFREWRITVVGEETFDVSIYTSDEAKDDWRKHQNISNRVDFRAEPFPDNLREKCIEYLGHMGLKFGAFDFIEDHAGKITFLECNPNGQFMWLENALGLKISCAISDELIRISEAY